MYVITNRELLTGKKSLALFGKRPNPKGAQELRILKVNRSGRGWRVSSVADRLSKTRVVAINKRYGLKLDTTAQWHGSLNVACDLFEQARSSGRSILFFVHGYNNDIGDVMVAAEAIEALYNVIVVPFSWPANGGGALSGTASYLSDKADARQSSAALNRAVGKIRDYHAMLTVGNSSRLRDTANRRHPNNSDAAKALFSRLQRQECQTRISLLCHSMGNYVFKHTLLTSDSVTNQLVFDNVCLVAADTNNEAHAQWVSRLDVRKRLYIVINEDDSALKASRIKPGEQQLARLGHYLRKLDADNSHYVDVTGAAAVGSEHTYFKGSAVKRNPHLAKLFNGMFNGQSVDEQLEYRADSHSYALKHNVD